ncbi:MAG: hypothetical protein HQ502_05425 [Alphaproteobacteria bacterium]|nr:hypothetical protein [Alphaproteobacteria bacterium]
MKITSTAITIGLFGAALLAFGNVAVAKEHSVQARELKPCNIHGRDAKDCHIHGQNAYYHLRLTDANNAGHHATMEFRRLHRLHNQMLRD